MVSGVHAANPLRGCFLASVSPLHLEKITTIMSSHPSAIPQRWRPNWPIWARRDQDGHGQLRYAMRSRKDSESTPRRDDFVIVSDGKTSPVHGSRFGSSYPRPVGD